MADTVAGGAGGDTIGGGAGNDTIGGGGGNQPWYGAPDAETLGYLQTRGLDKMTPDKAAMEAIKAHREAEKLIGAPADQMIRIPGVADVDGWNKVHARLGVPEKADAYDFSAVKNPDGTDLKPEDVTILRGMAHELRLDPARATVLVQKLVGIAKQEGEKQAATFAGNSAAELAAVKQNWGANAAANNVVAQNAAAKFGLDPAALNTNGAPITIPYSKALEMFRSMGQATGEHNFISGGVLNPTGVMTREQAQHRLEQIGTDKLWYKKFQDGDAAARKEFDDLTRLVAGQ